MKKADHFDQAAEYLNFADTQITANAQAMLTSAQAHATLALIERLDTLSYLLAAVVAGE